MYDVYSAVLHLMDKTVYSIAIGSMLSSIPRVRVNSMGKYSFTRVSLCVFTSYRYTDHGAALIACNVLIQTVPLITSLHSTVTAQLRADSQYL